MKGNVRVFAGNEVLSVNREEFVQEQVERFTQIGFPRVTSSEVDEQLERVLGGAVEAENGLSMIGLMMVNEVIVEPQRVTA